MSGLTKRNRMIETMGVCTRRRLLVHTTTFFTWPGWSFITLIVILIAIGMFYFFVYVRVIYYVRILYKIQL